MKKVRYAGRGITYHPALGKLEPGEEYQVADALAGLAFFQPAESDVSGEADGEPAAFRAFLEAKSMSGIRGIRNRLAEACAGGFLNARDTKKAELIDELVAAFEACEKKVRLRVFQTSMNREGGQQ